MPANFRCYIDSILETISYTQNNIPRTYICANAAKICETIVSINPDVDDVKSLMTAPKNNNRIQDLLFLNQLITNQ